MSVTLSSLLHRTRLGVLSLLLVVLPLQGTAQLLAGLQGPRHVHVQRDAAGDAGRLRSGVSEFAKPLLLLWSRLQAAQDGRLVSHKPYWPASLLGAASGLHAHDGVQHAHADGADDVLALADVADESAQGHATAFLAWLPGALLLPSAQAGGLRDAAAFGWRDRAVAPPLTPPRG